MKVSIAAGVGTVVLLLISVADASSQYRNRSARSNININNNNIKSNSGISSNRKGTSSRSPRRRRSRPRSVIHEDGDNDIDWGSSYSSSSSPSSPNDDWDLEESSSASTSSSFYDFEDLRQNRRKTKKQKDKTRDIGETERILLALEHGSEEEEEPVRSKRSTPKRRHIHTKQNVSSLPLKSSKRKRRRRKRTVTDCRSDQDNTSSITQTPLATRAFVSRAPAVTRKHKQASVSSKSTAIITDMAVRQTPQPKSHPDRTAWEVPSYSHKVSTMMSNKNSETKSKSSPRRAAPTALPRTTRAAANPTASTATVYCQGQLDSSSDGGNSSDQPIESWNEANCRGNIVTPNLDTGHRNHSLGPQVFSGTAKRPVVASSKGLYFRQLQPGATSSHRRTHRLPSHGRRCNPRRQGSPATPDECGSIAIATALQGDLVPDLPACAAQHAGRSCERRNRNRQRRRPDHSTVRDPEGFRSLVSPAPRPLRHQPARPRSHTPRDGPGQHGLWKMPPVDLQGNGPSTVWIFERVHQRSLHSGHRGVTEGARFVLPPVLPVLWGGLDFVGVQDRWVCLGPELVPFVPVGLWQSGLRQRTRSGGGSRPGAANSAASASATTNASIAAGRSIVPRTGFHGDEQQQQCCLRSKQCF